MSNTNAELVETAPTSREMFPDVEANPMTLIQRAIDKGADVDAIERLMGLYERWQEKQARAEFYQARMRFQAECPPIQKTKEVLNKDGGVRYRFAPLPEIEKAVRPILAKYGLSYCWDDEVTEDGLRTTCTLTHTHGYERTASFTVPVFQGYGTNAAQDVGSANTFGKRYSLLNVLGINPDDDADGEAAAPMSHDLLVNHNAVVREWMTSILRAREAIDAEDRTAAAEVIAEMPLKVWRTLWRAPSNGGMWETAQKAFMKDDEEFKEILQTIRKESGWYDDEQNQL